MKSKDGSYNIRGRMRLRIVTIVLCLCAVTLSRTVTGAETDRQLDRWLERVRAEDAGFAPWQWPQFQGAQRGELLASLEGLSERRPSYNPVVKFWMAAAELAAGLPGAEKRMASARAEMAHYLPEKSSTAESALVDSYANAGVKYVLWLLLEDARRKLRVCEERDLGRVPRNPPSLNRFLQLAGWFKLPMGHAEDLAIDCRIWLEENYARLKWDSTRKRFVGALAPGPELLQEFSRKYGMTVKPEHLKGSGGMLIVLTDIIKIMKQSPEAAKDPIAAELVLGMVEPAWVFNSQVRGEKMIYLDLPKISREVGIRVWQRWLLKHARNLKMKELYLLTVASGPAIHGFDRELYHEARAGLVTRTQKEYAASRGLPIERRFPKCMACLYMGGSVSLDEVQGLIQETIRDGKLGPLGVSEWLQALATSGRVEGLDLLLYFAEHGPKSSLRSTLWQFERYAGVPRNSRMMQGEKDLAGYLARHKAWFKATRAALVFNNDKNRFESPQGQKPQIW